MPMATKIFVPTDNLGCACISREVRDAYTDDCTLTQDALDDEHATADGWCDADADVEHEILIDREHMLQYDLDMELEQRK